MCIKIIARKIIQIFSPYSHISQVFKYVFNARPMIYLDNNHLLPNYFKFNRSIASAIIDLCSSYPTNLQEILMNLYFELWNMVTQHGEWPLIQWVTKNLWYTCRFDLNHERLNKGAPQWSILVALLFILFMTVLEVLETNALTILTK